MGHGNIILPTGPIVIVYKGWRRPKRKGNETPDKPVLQETQEIRERCMSEEIAVTSMESPSIYDTPAPTKAQAPQSTASSRNFQFINATKPLVNRDPDVRKLVRTHVMREFGKDRRQKKRLRMEREPGVAEEDASSKEREGREDKSGSALVCPKLRMVTPSSSYPTKMSPQFYRLLDYYLREITRAVYPLESLLTHNPAKTSWFQFAVTDDVLFHAILFSAAAHLSLVNGVFESEDTTLLMKPTLKLLTQRLEHSDSKLSDTTIGAVSCLAMTENMRGNRDKWKIHMAGLKEMVHIRGGVPAVISELQMKMTRADLDGAVDSLTMPYLHWEKPPDQTPLYKIIIPPSQAFL